MFKIGITLQDPTKDYSQAFLSSAVQDSFSFSASLDEQMKFDSKKSAQKWLNDHIPSILQQSFRIVEDK